MLISGRLEHTVVQLSGDKFIVGIYYCEKMTSDNISAKMAQDGRMTSEDHVLECECRPILFSVPSGEA